MPSKFTQNKSAATPQELRDVEPARDSQISPTTCPLCRSEFQQRTSAHSKGFPARSERAIHARAKVSPGDRDHTLFGETQTRPGDGDLQRGRSLRISCQPVGQPEPQVIH